jgi:hypothetical protein
MWYFPYFSISLLLVIHNVICFSPFSTTDYERLLQRMERISFTTVLRKVTEQGYTIKGFYHTSKWRHYWAEVIDEQIRLLANIDADENTDEEVFGQGDTEDSKKSPLKPGRKGSKKSKQKGPKRHRYSLYDASKALYINVAGSDAEDMESIQSVVTNTLLSDSSTTAKWSEGDKKRYLRKLEFHFNHTLERRAWLDANESTRAMYEADQRHLSTGESSTIEALYDYCKREVSAERKSFVYYIHSKGECCYSKKNKMRNDPNPDAVSSWRDVMNTYNIEFPSICLRALLKGYSTCGYGQQGGHYAGNFFWADCHHVASLPPLVNKFDAWKAEFFLMRISDHYGNIMDFMRNCAYETYHCNEGKINHYAEPCLRSSYYEHIRNLLNISQPLPALSTSTVALAAPSGVIIPGCREYASKGPYETQDSWRFSNASYFASL